MNNLGEDQKEFIRAKVQVLGSSMEVERFYNKDDEVCQFAKTVAKGLFKAQESIFGVQATASI